MNELVEWQGEHKVRPYKTTLNCDVRVVRKCNRETTFGLLINS